jgi:hypothetical protein
VFRFTFAVQNNAAAAGLTAASPSPGRLRPDRSGTPVPRTNKALPSAARENTRYAKRAALYRSSLVLIAALIWLR